MKPFLHTILGRKKDPFELTYQRNSVEENRHDLDLFIPQESTDFNGRRIQGVQVRLSHDKRGFHSSMLLEPSVRADALQASLGHEIYSQPRSHYYGMKSRQALMIAKGRKEADDVTPSEQERIFTIASSYMEVKNIQSGHGPDMSKALQQLEEAGFLTQTTVEAVKAAYAFMEKADSKQKIDLKPLNQQLKALLAPDRSTERS